MSDASDRSGADPRLDSREQGDPLAEADLAAQPEVARRRDGLSLWVGVAVLGVLAVGLFAWLSSARHRAAEPDLVDAARNPGVAAPPMPMIAPPPVLPAASGPITTVPGPQFTTNNALPVAPPMAMPPTPPPAGAAPPAGLPPTAEQRRRAPAVVVDLGPPDATVANPALSAVRISNPALAPAADTAARSTVSDEERFAERVGAREVDQARAVQLKDLGTLVAQGATISATLETALDSDLPGYARAVVSRDVKSFDGKNLLIPRGSRVIGQYKAATALGASRVFVIWTRLIRPDAASIQLASPGADDLGRAGLTGKVDRHFFTRFGGAILLSVINAGVAAASSLQTSAQVYIGSSSDATSVAAAAVQKDGSTPPTIRTPQGAAVNIFVARDLDFSAVGAAR